MDDKVKQLLKKPIQLADMVTEVAGNASYFKQECGEIKSKTEKLQSVLRQAARASSRLSESLTLHITEETELILNETLSLILKCHANGLMKRIFTIIPTAALRTISIRLHRSIGHVSWRLRGDDFLGLPRFAGSKRMVFPIWEQFGIVYTGWPEDGTDASLVTLASENYRKLNIKDGVCLMLNLLKEGKMEVQDMAARAIGILGGDPKNVEHLINFGVFSVFAKILEERPTIVQATVAWAVFVLVISYPKCQDLLVQHNIITLLVNHLIKTVEDYRKYVTVIYYTTEAARALWYLAKGNSLVCRIIAKSGALPCFAFLLEIGRDALQYYSAMVVMEITAVVEKDADTRELPFNPNSPACKSVVDQMLKIIELKTSELLIPCIKTIANLARTFKANTQTRIIGPLVRLLDDERVDVEITCETLIVLTKFACTENKLHMDHCKAIISVVGAKRLIHLVLGESMVRIPALILLSYIGLHLPHSKEVAETNVLALLEWASKQSSMILDENVQELLLESKSRLELYQIVLLEDSTNHK